MAEDFEDKDDKELWKTRHLVSQELGLRLDKSLENLLEEYNKLYGYDVGIQYFGDELCRLANRKRFYSHGWDGFVKYLVAASG